jgi:N-acetylmuramoyl-L-alanine amidase-like protein
MAFSLTWLPQVLLNAGLRVAEQRDWRNLGRGDISAIRGVMCHHTAGTLSGNMPSLGIVTNGRENLPGPLAQLCLGRDGTFFVVAAGRANHAGVGNWQGLSSGNSSFIGIGRRTLATHPDLKPIPGGGPDGCLSQRRRGDSQENRGECNHVLRAQRIRSPCRPQARSDLRHERLSPASGRCHGWYRTSSVRDTRNGFRRPAHAATR